MAHIARKRPKKSPLAPAAANLGGGLWNDGILATRKKQAFARRLRTWFRRHARILPWRADRDPYRVWVSEIMLQQTQVATVEGYFGRFLAAFPTIVALAAADEQVVLRRWEGLGYYRRARQMHRAAREIVERHGGEFPRDAEAVRRLPGIGRYTAGAILSIAFDQSEPILEANTVRLLCRLFAFRGDPHSTAGQKRLWEAAEALLPKDKPGEFNQALMELGSLICTPKSPNCDTCPVVELCPTRAAGLQAEIPAAKRKPAIESVRQAAIIVRRGRRVLLVQRAEGERWAGLWDFPRITLGDEQGAALARRLADAVADELGVEASPMNRLAVLRHSVTRFRITLECHVADYVSAAQARRHPKAPPDSTASFSSRTGPTRPAKWFAAKSLAKAPLNVTGRKISQLAIF